MGNRTKIGLALLTLWMTASLLHDVRADALVRTQAMLASTIAELYVEEEGVRVELEIGVDDLDVFRNLMPDELYEKLGHEPKPFAERGKLFFAEDLVLLGDGLKLGGGIVELGARDRIRRDGVTGEPLPPEEGEAETVVYGRLMFPFDERPGTLTIGGAIGARAGVGFVVYHEGIAVNDFRYLAHEQTLDLDWEDPWYSAFRSRALRRAYFASMSGFLYVEAYEVRKEIILRPKDLQHWIDLGLDGRETIPVEMQEELKRKVAAFLRERHPVAIDGKSVEPDLAQINFLERTLRTSRVIDPPEELDVDAAILGVIFVYPTGGLPQHVTMDWDLFNERIQVVPGSAVDQAGPLPSYLEPDFNVLEWKNFLKNPELPTPAVVSLPPTLLARGVRMLRWPLVGVIVLIGWMSIAAARRSEGLARRAALLLATIAVTAGCFWYGGPARISDEDAKEIVGDLLHNIYLAHDFRDEERIYDTLGNSVAGELLTEIYLETRRGLELANQGGARAKVKQIEMAEADAHSADGGAFTAEATWVVRGSVGHWGHLHERSNRYRAELEIRPTDGVWKVAGLQLLEEERL